MRVAVEHDNVAWHKLGRLDRLGLAVAQDARVWHLEVLERLERLLRLHLLEEADKIMKAQQARGADFESGNVIQRAKSLIPILVPLFVSAFRIAQDLAMAMEARCYRGGENRTRMHEMKFQRRDYAAVALMIAFGAVIVVESRIF